MASCRSRFKRYRELLPDLTVEQQAEILANLLEAREYAMDAGSSDEKHAWFGKYKGRINNFLSDGRHRHEAGGAGFGGTGKGGSIGSTESLDSEALDSVSHDCIVREGVHEIAYRWTIGGLVRGRVVRIVA